MSHEWMVTRRALTGLARMGLPPVRFEMINAISGVDFDHAWAGRVPGRYGEVDVNYISLADLLANKRAAGRSKDLADCDELGGSRQTEHEDQERR